LSRADKMSKAIMSLLSSISVKLFSKIQIFLRTGELSLNRPIIRLYVVSSTALITVKLLRRSNPPSIFCQVILFLEGFDANFLTHSSLSYQVSVSSMVRYADS
jgi:hypothetical protein